MKVGASASNHLPKTSLELPAVTLCSVVQIDSVRLTSFVKDLSNTTEANKYSQQELHRMFQQTGGFFHTVSYNESDLMALERIINTTSFTMENVMNRVQTPCEEMLVKCRLEGLFYPCIELFEPVVSQYGMCCIFNSNRNQNASSLTNGKTSLSVILRPDPVLLTGSEALKLLVYESNTSASTSQFETMLSLHTEISVEFSPVLRICSKELGEKSISERNCLYEHEKKLRHFRDYRQLNCKIECILVHIQKACNCLPYYYSMYSSTYRTCSFSDIKCLVDKYWSMLNVEHNETSDCDCMPNCVDFIYQAVLTQTQLNEPKFAVGSFYDGITSEHIVLHVSFGKQTYTAITKELATNILALTANLGGTYSLFIGFSAITFFEIIYYFCVRFYLNYKKEVMCKKKLAKNHQLMISVIRKMNAK